MRLKIKIKIMDLNIAKIVDFSILTTKKGTIIMGQDGGGC